VGRQVRGNRSGSVAFGQGAQVSYLVSYLLSYLLSWLLSYLVALGRTGSHWAGLRDTYSLCAESLDHGQLQANTLTATPPTSVRPVHRRARATKQGPSCATS